MRLTEMKYNNLMEQLDDVYDQLIQAGFFDQATAIMAAQDSIEDRFVRESEEQRV